MKLADFDALIFDMDGVITDSETLHMLAEIAACREIGGFDPPPEDWKEFNGRSAEDNFRIIYGRYGGGQEPDMPALMAAKVHEYKRIVEQGLPTVPGAIDFLKRVRPLIGKMALCTSSDSAIQQDIFRRLVLAPYFDVVVTADQVRHAKPHPEPYGCAVEKLGFLANRCLVIEDSDNGIRSAKAAGCVVAGITTTFPADVLKSCGADVIFNTYEDLSRLLGLPASDSL